MSAPVESSDDCAILELCSGGRSSTLRLLSTPSAVYHLFRPLFNEFPIASDDDDD